MHKRRRSPACSCAALRETLAAGEQAILFLNRRGFSTFSLCKACGEAVRCRHCSVTLTYHRGDDACSATTAASRRRRRRSARPAASRRSSSWATAPSSSRQLLGASLPGARMARLDRDTAAGDGLQRLLDAFRAREIDVLVGTQMVTKGHDFPGVTLVGVVLADQGLNLPDFRASERTFQLLEQVAGRAGRGDKPGRVHPADVPAARRRHHLRARPRLRALRRRRAAHARRAALSAAHAHGLRARRRRRSAAGARHGRCAPPRRRARSPSRRRPRRAAAVLGPTEAPLSRLKGRTRWQLFVQSHSRRALRALARAAAEVGAPRGVRLSIDIDPSPCCKPLFRRARCVKSPVRAAAVDRHRRQSLRGRAVPSRARRDRAARGGGRGRRGRARCWCAPRSRWCW